MFIKKLSCEIKPKHSQKSMKFRMRKKFGAGKNLHRRRHRRYFIGRFQFGSLYFIVQTIFLRENVYDTRPSNQSIIILQSFIRRYFFEQKMSSSTIFFPGLHKIFEDLGEGSERNEKRRKEKNALSKSLYLNYNKFFYIS